LTHTHAPPHTHTLTLSPHTHTHSTHSTHTHTHTTHTHQAMVTLQLPRARAHTHTHTHTPGNGDAAVASLAHRVLGQTTSSPSHAARGKIFNARKAFCLSVCFFFFYFELSGRLPLRPPTHSLTHTQHAGDIDGAANARQPGQQREGRDCSHDWRYRGARG